MTNSKSIGDKFSLGFTPSTKRIHPGGNQMQVFKPRRREPGIIDATLESQKTRENKRKAAMKNYYESKQLLSLTKHLDTMKAAYFEKMKREQYRVGRSLWELEQRKRKIMRQIYEHPRATTNNSRNPGLFYFTKQKTQKRSRKRPLPEKTCE